MDVFVDVAYDNNSCDLSTINNLKAMPYVKDVVATPGNHVDLNLIVSTLSNFPGYFMKFYNLSILEDVPLLLLDGNKNNKYKHLRQKVTYILLIQRLERLARVVTDYQHRTNKSYEIVMYSRPDTFYASPVYLESILQHRRSVLKPACFDDNMGAIGNFEDMMIYLNVTEYYLNADNFGPGYTEAFAHTLNNNNITFGNYTLHDSGGNQSVKDLHCGQYIVRRSEKSVQRTALHTSAPPWYPYIFCAK
jgi:hypothetical protein